MIEWFTKWLYRWTSGDPFDKQAFGYGVPPGAECQFEFGEIDDGKPMFTATTYNNDGYELWIAYSHGGWLCHFKQKDARHLAKLILWDWWVVSTWCGLKRRIWYWALHESVKKLRHPLEAK